MKRIFLAFAFLVLLVSPAMAVDNFAPASPAGSDNPGDIDTLQLANNNATVRLLDTYREGLTLSYSTAAQLAVAAGNVWCQNSAGTVYRQRKLSTASTITWSDIDTGTEANSTTYYAYAIGDTDAAAPTFKVSTSATAPTGVTYYKRLGSFYNDVSGNIINIKNDNTMDRVFDSDWFSIAMNGEYTFPHTLGTQNLVTQIYVASNSTGANMTTGNGASDGVYYHGIMARIDSPTTVIVRVGQDLPWIYDGSNFGVAAYAKVKIITLEE